MQNITPETTATHQRSDKGELWKLSFCIMTDSENKPYLREGQTGFVIIHRETSLVHHKKELIDWCLNYK